MIKLKESKIISDFEKGPIRRSLFTNGAVSLFHKHSGMSSATVSLYFLAGSINEKKGEEGIVHLIEHMLFKEGKDSQIVKELEFHGADINAYTYKEFVCFELDCAANKLKKFLPLFLKLFFNPVFNENDLELEKKVVVQELKDELDDHEMMGHEYILENTFSHDLGHSIGGSPKSVKSFACSDLKKFYKKYFTPNRMILSIVSGKSANYIEDILLAQMQNYKSFQKQNSPKRLESKDYFSTPPAFKKTMKRKIENAIYYYAVGGPALNSRYYYDLVVIDEYFFEGLSSKFFLELREKYGLLYGLGSALSSYYKTGLYVMIFNGSKDKMDEIKRHIKRILSEHKKSGFNDKDIEAIKDRMIDGARRSFDDMEERNEFIAMRELYGEGDFSLQKDIESIRKVTTKTLEYLFSKIFNGKNIELTILPK